MIRTEFMWPGNRGEFFSINRAGVLADRAIDYFAEDGEVHGIKFNWYHPSQILIGKTDNYDTYIQALSGAINPNDLEAMQEAALQTWTFGRVAEPNGFIQPGVIVHRTDETLTETGRQYPWLEPKSVHGLFLKPGVI